MNIYLLERTDDFGYDEYDSAILVAKSAKAAAKIAPNGIPIVHWGISSQWGWVDSPDKVKVKRIGTALKNAKTGVVCASFNAG